MKKDLMRPFVRGAGLFGASLLKPFSLAAQGCALCRIALESSGNKALIRGLSWSILLMVAVPSLILGAFARLIYNASRRPRPMEPGA